MTTEAGQRVDPIPVGTQANQPTKRSTTQPGTKSRSMVLPAAGASLIVMGALALIAWQTGIVGVRQYTQSSQDRAQQARKGASSPSSKSPDGSDDVEAPPPGPIRLPSDVGGPSATSKGSERKPSEPNRKASGPISSPAPAPKPNASSGSKLAVEPANPPPLPGPAQPRVLATPQDVFVQTNPPGANAVLDGHPESACETPCILLGEPGLHSLSLIMQNYQSEVHQIRVGNTRLELPPFTLRALSGTLFLTTTPPGANVFIDDHLQAQMTPATISLPLGSYTVRVERDGVRKTAQVQIRDSSTHYVHIPLN